MTPRGSARRSVPRSRSSDFLRVAEVFRGGAETAKEFGYWNAAGVLIVHAAIAYTDALTVRVAGAKSAGEDHMAAVDLLHAVVRLDEGGRKAARHLARMIEEKNLVSYSGELYPPDAVERLWRHLDRYRAWALTLLS